MLSGVRDFVNDGHPQLLKFRTRRSVLLVKLRALKALRISVKTDESTSIERQDEVLDDRIAREGWALAGVARDEGVSASKVDPWSRPELGPWLNTRYDEYDAILWWRMDRAVRSMSDLNDLIKFAKDHRKMLVFCTGPGSNQTLDFTQGDKADKVSELVAMIVSWAADLESEANSDRVKSSHAWLRKHGEWGGGTPPYGFVPQRVANSERGWRLVHEPETVAVLRELVDRVLNDESLLSIAKDFNARGIPTPRDWWAKYKGREVQNRLWNVTTMAKILRSKSLLGEWWINGRIVLDDNGDAVVRGKPIVQPSEWEDVQAALNSRTRQGQRASENHPLLHVAMCARCGRPYYVKRDVQKGATYIKLSCSTRHGDRFASCGQPTLSLKYVEAFTETMALMAIGREEVLRRKFVPGDDRSEELKRLKVRLRDLEDEYDDPKSELSSERYKERRSRYVAAINAIGPNPVQDAHFVWQGTGQTYAEIWPTLDPAGRRQLLIDLGIRVYAGRGDSSAADKALRMLGDADSKSHRIAVVVGPDDMPGLLEDVQDGARIKKDFGGWVLQDGPAPIAELITRKSS